MKRSEAQTSPSLPALPIEILSQIFLGCVDLDGSLTSTDTIDVPLLLTQICHGWRSVAIGTQILWSRLSLNIKPNAAHQASLVSTWLTRSGACPLQIYIMWEQRPFYPSHPVLDLLAQHSHRWRNMFFFLPFEAYESLSSIRGNLPILSELSLGTDCHPMSSPIIDAFEIAPQLRSLECVNLRPESFKLPLQDLSKIPIMDVTVKDCFKILRQAPHLQNGSFIFVDFTTSGAPPRLLFRHDALRELAILTSPWDEQVEVTDLFQFLDVPHLQSLRICNLQWLLTADIHLFLSRVDALETLHLRKNALSEADLLQILAIVPSLKHLTILSTPSSYTITHNFLDCLVWEPTENSLVPRLETLEFSMYTPMGPSFVKLLESRWNVEDTEDELPRASRMEKVTAITDEEFGDDVLGRLESLALEGMTIVIQSPEDGPDSLCDTSHSRE
ncbi:hypothetical protein Hypma_010866 [Hypsizygus marmoreus]|uniref:Uncharacterized protein n=1 Tax=Hypsizygus marmoreus TaxID=39966 RepID=A0A369JQ95_HYPMA|nr:hypothetical protein Hypma_010866 [Hypsizygus marmoreus]